MVQEAIRYGKGGDSQGSVTPMARWLNSNWEAIPMIFFVFFF